MGTYLSTPVLDKCWEEGEDFDNTVPVAWGVVDMQGWRKTMEDAHIAQTDVQLPHQRKGGGTGGGKSDGGDNNNIVATDHAQVFAVFDGHGGAEVARFCQLYMVDVLTRQKEWVGGGQEGHCEADVGKALISCFHAMDDLLRDPKRRDEIFTLKSNKPNFAERRKVIDEPEQLDGEEKKIEETRVSSSVEADSFDNSSNNTDHESTDTVTSLNNTTNSKRFDAVGDIHQVESTCDIGVDNDSSEASIDISADSVSLFSRLLTITNKAGVVSGTIPLNMTNGGRCGTQNNSNEEDNQVITPTILQNGRPVCNLPDHPIHAGCTSVCAVINGKTLTVANAGDSRVVLCRAGGVTEAMSFDHKPMQETEMNRIISAGGFVNQFGRVNGNLNLSRSIGDLKYKQMPNIPPAAQMITAEPDIKQIELKDDDEFIILACDGIWDCLTNEEAVKFVRDRIDKCTPTEIGVEMLDKIVSKDPRETQGIGGDNMTVMIVDILPYKRSYRSGITKDEFESKNEKEAIQKRSN